MLYLGGLVRGDSRVWFGRVVSVVAIGGGGGGSSRAN